MPFGDTCPFPVPQNPRKSYDLGVLPPNASGESTKCCQLAPFSPMCRKGVAAHPRPKQQRSLRRDPGRMDIMEPWHF